MKTIISTIIVALLSCISFVYAQQNIPSDFPKHQDTGNRKADNATYDQAKKAWVEANPETYQKMNEQAKANSKIKKQPTPQQKEGISTIIPDDENYDNAKKAWIEANPEVYRKMGGQIKAKPEVNEHSIETEVENCEKTEDVAITIPNNCVTWKITDAIIIDENNQLKTSELGEKNIDVEKEILRQKILWKISPEGMFYVLNDRKYADHFKFEKAKNQLKLFPPDNTTCNTEVKTFYIKKWTDTQIIINMPGEHEGSTLMYQLTLTPIF